MNKITIVVLAMLALTIGVYAQSASDTCKVIEYAELKDTPKNDLLNMSCLYDRLGYIELEGAKSLIGAPEIAQQHIDQATQCFNERQRILGILDRAYHIPIPSDADCATKPWLKEEVKP